MIFQTADVASMIDVFNCNIANKMIQIEMDDQYGIKCNPDYQDQIDKSSAYKWALESSCTLSDSLLCKIVDFANSINFTIAQCNPKEECVSTKLIDCQLIITDIITGEESCALDAAGIIDIL